jgi:acetoacetate decarboxylase
MIRGKLTAADLGSVVPVTSPPYTPGRRDYEGIDTLRFRYRTDAKAAARLIPDVFEIEDEPIATISWVSFGVSSPGAYREVGTWIDCRYEGEVFGFALRFYVTNDVAMVAGREWIGFAKMHGHIAWDPAAPTNDAPIHARLERPEGLLLATGVFMPTEYVGEGRERSFTSWNLRVIPSAIPGERPAVRELVHFGFTTSGGSIWKGLGAPHFSGASPIDPLHELPVLEMLEATYVRGSRLRVDAPDRTVALD